MARKVKTTKKTVYITGYATGKNKDLLKGIDRANNLRIAKSNHQMLQEEHPDKNVRTVKLIIA